MFPACLMNLVHISLNFTSGTSVCDMYTGILICSDDVCILTILRWNVWVSVCMHTAKQTFEPLCTALFMK